MDRFKLVAPFKPTGDQPEAIAALTAGLNAGMPWQTLLGITGSGKTFTMANVIANANRPALVLAHNKTLAAQLPSQAVIGHRVHDSIPLLAFIQHPIVLPS